MTGIVGSIRGGGNYWTASGVESGDRLARTSQRQRQPLQRRAAYRARRDHSDTPTEPGPNDTRCSASIRRTAGPAPDKCREHRARQP